MKSSGPIDRQERRRSVAIAVFLLIQTVAAVFFVGDALADLDTDIRNPESILEMTVGAVLLLGIVFGGWQLRLALERIRNQERTLVAARGDLGLAIDTQFAEWGLTPAERDVGFLALKGLDIAEIAAMRQAAEGTVRAQLARIYAKADVSGRAQFAAWFIEDLLGESVLGRKTDDKSEEHGRVIRQANDRL